MPIKPDYQRILDNCHEMVHSHLTALLDRMFENADIGLMDFAEKAESNASQALFFEAMNEVRNKRPDVDRCFHEEVRNSFKQFPDWTPQLSEDSEEDDEDNEFSFSLVQADTMEEDVAITNILTRASAQIQDNLNALIQRLSVINEGIPIEEQQIPGGPSALAHAFRLASYEMEMDTKVRLVMIALFDKFVMSKTGLVYSEYNERLVQAGILPKLKYKVHKYVTSGASADSVGQPGEQDGPSEAGEGEATTPAELGAELFGNICQMLAGRHPGAAQVAGAQQPVQAGVTMPQAGAAQAGVTALPGFQSVLTPANGPVTGPALAPAETLVGSIQQMQGHVQARQTVIASDEFIENILVDENLVTTLQQTLFEERQKIFGAVDRRKVPSADSDVIDLVGMLFEYMLKEEQLPNIVKALLSRLHTPMLKVAILDRGFFTQSKHPARRLLNDMISAGIRWVKETDMDTGIFPKMREIVDELLRDFEENVEIFERFEKEFDQVVEEVKQRSEVVERRTNEAANGQEKLMAARNRAQKEIRSLLSGKAIARASCDLLIKLWSDKLTFILLRESTGDESDAWHSAAQLAADIVYSTIPPKSEEERLNRESELDGLQQSIRAALATTQHAEKEALLLALFNSQREILRQSAEDLEPVVEVVESPIEQVPEIEEEPEIEPLTADQQAALDKLAELPFGTWFDFREGVAGKALRAKLSWRSTITKKCMFVDQMGVKAAVIPMTDLARALVSGNARIVVPEKKPFVDRALGAIHRMLDRSVAATA